MGRAVQSAFTGLRHNLIMKKGNNRDAGNLNVTDIGRIAQQSCSAKRPAEALSAQPALATYRQ
jgi:hypothetical protein